MCGRSACSRDCEAIRQSCSYRRKQSSKKVTSSLPPAPPPTDTTSTSTCSNGANDDGWSYGVESLTKPTWITINDQKYYPSYNISPQTNTPVLLSSQHSHIKGCGLREEEEELTERVIQVMKWGLIPQWHRGDPKSFPSLLNNCRFEGMFDKPSFRSAINRRQRCVVLCEGFYEWKRTGKGKDKQPYFVYFTHSSLEDKSNRMLTLAGLYDIWTPEDRQESSLYSYTIITTEASKSFSTIHDRLPAVLENDIAIDTWLDVSISTSQAVKCIRSTGSEELSWYPVSSTVNNARNNSPECIVKIDLDARKNKGTLHNWFKASTVTTTSDSCSDQPPLLKKAKCVD